MKKFFVGLIVALIFPTTILGYSITDPLYAPEKSHLMGDLSFGFTNNDFDLAKSYALYGSLTMGVSDKLSLGVGFGWAKIIHESTGFQDLSIKFKYRFLNGLVDDMFLDIDGYVSPEMFHSPWNKEGGSAQGATSLGAIVSVGTLNALDNFNLFAKLGLEHIGHRDTINAGSLLSLRTGAKYYINETLYTSGSQLYKGGF